MIPALVSAIPSLFKAGYGLQQMIKGSRGLNNLERPEYAMPKEAQMNLAMAATASADPYSVGELRAQSNIGQSAANAAASARDGGNASQMAPAIQAQQSAAYNQLQTQTEADQERRRQSLTAALTTVGNYRDQEWQMNKFAPYADKYAEFRQMQGAGAQNVFSGIDGLGAIGAQYAAGAGGGAASVTPSAAAQATTASAQQTGSIQAVFQTLMQGMQQQAGNAPGVLSQLAKRPYILPY